jgi:hypothetical protein
MTPHGSGLDADFAARRQAAHARVDAARARAAALVEDATAACDRELAGVEADCLARHGRHQGGGMFHFVCDRCGYCDTS